MQVTVTKASRAQEPILQNLAQLYTHDFSEYWAGTSNGDLLPDGRFAAYPLDEYWRNPAWVASMIWCGDALAGFALVNNLAHSGKPVEHNMAEFFILRKHRGRGVGRLAAESIFAQHPGLWEVAIARRNVPALSFWRNIVGRTGKAQGAHEIDVSNAQWNGPILRFEWNPKQPPNP